MEHQLEQVKAELVAEKEAREALEVRYFFFLLSSLLFSRKKVLGCRAVLLGSLQAQTVFTLATFQLCFW